MAERILGVDPGLNITGYGVIDVEGNKVTLVEAGVVRGKAKTPLYSRVKEIHAGISDVISANQPTTVAIEELYSHYERPQTAILMGHARGVICLAAAQHDLQVVNYAATQVKKVLTGNGRAPKSQVQLAIAHQFKLPAAPDPPDVADALAIALCHHYLGRKLSATL